jgi:glycosyltransferase involved in cell wall biosynthesis
LQLAGDGAENQLGELRELAASLGVPVDFPGWVDSAGRRELLRRASMFILPSLDENFAVAAAEALAAAVPVIATRGVAIIDLVERSGAGFVVDGNAQAIAEAIDRLAFDDEERMRRARAARSLAAATFRWSGIAESLRRTYEEILSS